MPENLDEIPLDDIAFKKERTAARRDAAATKASYKDCLEASLRAIADKKHLDFSEFKARRSVQKARELIDANHQQDTPPLGLWRAWFDGSYRPLDQTAGVGVFIVGPDDEQIEISKTIDLTRNPEAADSIYIEGLALITALKAAHDAGVQNLEAYGDNDIIVAIVGAHPLNISPRLLKIKAEANDLAALFTRCKIIWTPRKNNAVADCLSRHKSTIPNSQNPAFGSLRAVADAENIDINILHHILRIEGLINSKWDMTPSQKAFGNGLVKTIGESEAQISLWRIENTLAAIRDSAAYRDLEITQNKSATQTLSIENDVNPNNHV